jgi:hypothetical protein
MPILEGMEYTVLEIAKRLEKTKGDGGISSDAARQRLKRHGYEPKRYIGVNAMFDLTDSDIEYLKQCDKRGPGSKARTASKTEKKTKKKS